MYIKKPPKLIEELNHITHLLTEMKLVDIKIDTYINFLDKFNKSTNNKI